MFIYIDKKHSLKRYSFYKAVYLCDSMLKSRTSEAQYTSNKLNKPSVFAINVKDYIAEADGFIYTHGLSLSILVIT